MADWMGATPGRSRSVKPLRVTVDDAGIRQLLGWLSLYPARLERAERLAVNRAAPGVRTDLVKELAETIALPQKLIRAGISVVKKTSKTASARVEARGRNRLLLYAFSPRPKSVSRKRPAGGVSVLVRRDRGRRTVLESFLAAPVSGRRRGETNIYRRAGRGRYPVYPLYGPNWIAYLRDEENAGALGRVLARAGNRLGTELERAADFVIFDETRAGGR